MVKNPPAMQETQVQSLGWEDPLKKGVATHSSILAWRIPWAKKLVGCSPWGRKQSDTTEQVTLTFTSDTVPLESARICHLSVDLLTNFAILCKYRTH